MKRNSGFPTFRVCFRVCEPVRDRQTDGRTSNTRNAVNRTAAQQTCLVSVKYSKTWETNRGRSRSWLPGTRRVLWGTVWRCVASTVGIYSVCGQNTASWRSPERRRGSQWTRTRAVRSDLPSCVQTPPSAREWVGLSGRSPSSQRRSVRVHSTRPPHQALPTSIRLPRPPWVMKICRLMFSADQSLQ